MAVAQDVIAGDYGSGDTRKKNLEAKGYNYSEVQDEVNRLLCCRELIIQNMRAWATKVSAENYHYVYWDEPYGHECAKCHPHGGANEGWQCIGWAFAVWHHGGLPSKCNCGVIDNDTWEKILNAKTDKEALSIAQKCIGIKEIEVIRNKNGIPKSQTKPGDIGALYVKKDGNPTHYQHTIFIMSNSKISDSTHGKTKADDIRADRSFSGRYVNDLKLLIRYTGNGLITAPKKSIEQLAYEVIDGLWYSGDVRKTALTQAGYDYNAVQAKVNDILNPKKTIDELAHEVLEGKWGSGDERKRRLTEAGYDYYAVQARVNELLRKYTGILPTTQLVKNNAQVIEDTIKWALWIASDNRFHYGYTNKSTGANAHHNGCYFCGTQRMKKHMLMPEYTYCCNPFVGAAWAHGGGVPKALKLCQACNSWDFNVGHGYDASSLFNKLGHPAKSKLKAGDVLCNDHHVALYIGNNKIAEASHGDDNKKNSTKWNDSIHVTSLTDSRYKGFDRVYRFNGSVNTTSIIRHGEVSYRVVQWQAFLDWYFDGKVGSADGYFGDNTKKWTIKFQEEVIGKGTGDGLVGNITLEAAAKVTK